MWVIAMFDLPVHTPKARKAYARFRKDLIEDGFTMMQYSIYIRHCASIENAKGPCCAHGQARAGCWRGAVSYHHRQTVRPHRHLRRENTPTNSVFARQLELF